jgi:tRNA pseudouridine38-40 synthase
MRRLETMRYFVQLAYKGTHYHGWQSQPNAISVQSILENAFSKILREKIELTGAGRTDTGVHASYYVAHFDCQCENLDQKIVHSINSILPFDIALSAITKVKPTAHARFYAMWRSYQYKLVFHKDVFNQEYAWFLHLKPDMDIMNQAAQLLLKQTDFASFCKAHSDNKTTICQLLQAEWVANENSMVFHIKADRFLRNMVRAVVGTLLDVGWGKISLDDFQKIIDAKSRNDAGQSVPAHGLFLTGIGYPEDIYLNNVSSM